MAGDGLEHNLNPVGRTFYRGCRRCDLHAGVGSPRRSALGLGAQAGEARLTEVLREAGFLPRSPGDRNPVSTFILEARP